MSRGSITGGVPGAPVAIASGGVALGGGGVSRPSSLTGKVPARPTPLPAALPAPASTAAPAASALVPIAPVSRSAVGAPQADPRHGDTPIRPAAAASAYESVLARGSFPEPGTRLGLRV